LSDGRIGNEPDTEDAYLLRQNGDALHSARFDINRLKKIKRSLQPRHWSALYQQNPVPDEGVYFTKDMFRYASEAPAMHSMKLYCAWDLAIGEKQQNDWTVGVVGGLDYNDQVFILDVIRFRGDSYRIVEAILDTYQKYKPEMIGIEKGQLEQAIRPILRKRMAERRIYPVFAEGDKALVPITDKMTRARPLQGRMQQGMVYFLEQPWLENLRHELLRFPGGVHDDMVDAMAWLMRMLMGEQPPRKPKHLTQKSWKDSLSKYVKGNTAGEHMAA
jgi:predicted phage terminase large subunit-like protein